MNKIKKFLIVVFSCVITVSSLALFAACGNVEDKGRKASASDPIVGAWICEDIPTDSSNGYQNVKLYYDVSYFPTLYGDYGTKQNDIYFKIDIYERIYNPTDSQTTTITTSANISVQNVADKHYDVTGGSISDGVGIYKINPGAPSVRQLYCHIVLNEMNTSFGLYYTDSQGNCETEPKMTFTRATMTLDEFKALDVTPQN